MPENPGVEKITIRDHEFIRKIRAEGITHLDRCYQCSACSDGCPVAYAMDYHPHQIIYMVKMGLKENVLQSRAIWICASCETCATRCPNEVNIVRLMDLLRKEALHQGFKRPLNNIPKFHHVFVKEIQNRGRIHEAGLLLHYKLKSSNLSSLKNFSEEFKLGLQMFRKGKLKLFSQEKHDKRKVREIFKKIMADKKH